LTKGKKKTNLPQKPLSCVSWKPKGPCVDVHSSLYHKLLNTNVKGATSELLLASLAKLLLTTVKARSAL